jgi:hypothetical protein
MEEKIVLKVIDIVEKTVNAGEKVPVSSLMTTHGREIPDVFKFASVESQTAFTDMAQGAVTKVVNDSFRLGFVKGFIKGVSVFAGGVVLGYTAVIVYDKIKHRKNNKKSDI